MDDTILVETVLSYLKQKGDLSDLEKDLLLTVEKYIESPFDRKSAEQRIIENNAHYPDIIVAIGALPDIQIKSFDELTDMDVHHDLYLQIQAMWMKIINSECWMQKN